MTSMTQSSNHLEKGRLNGTFPFVEKDEFNLSPEMREEIDKDIAISQEQFRNGRYRKLDDQFMKEFLEEAHERNAGVFKR